MTPKPQPSPELADVEREEKMIAALESARNPQPLPEDPSLVNANNLPIYMALARSGEAIAEARAIYKRLGYG